MALSISANQENIKDVFDGDKSYIIPMYQRPYSWGYEHCEQLFLDIVNSYEAEEEYFLGNIIMARADNQKDQLYVVDGQQRLITLWLFLKIVSLYCPNIVLLKRLLTRDSWDGSTTECKIKSEVSDTGGWAYQKDLGIFVDIMDFSFEIIKNKMEKYSNKNGVYCETKCENRFEANAITLYRLTDGYMSNLSDQKRNSFVKHLLDNIYMLPIEMSGKNLTEASDKAIVIFETINNRGMSLQDADIFKAKLYNEAKNNNKEEEFMSSWVELQDTCDQMSLSIDDMFRYYSHIIRGKNDVSTNEKKLRDFFLSDPISPLGKYSYDTIIQDLYQILCVIKFIKHEIESDSETGMWLKILEKYSNQYPQYAIVSYLFFNTEETSNTVFNTFLEKLTRYVYSKGATTTVKFEIYSMIKSIANNRPISDYRIEETINWNNAGKLRYGLALLNYWLENNCGLGNYRIKRLLKNYTTGNNSYLNDIPGNFYVTTGKASMPISNNQQSFVKKRNDEILARFDLFFKPKKA